MATITTTFRLVDDVSGTMRNVNNSVSSATKGFESLSGKLVALNSVLGLARQGFEMLKNVVGGIFGQAVSDASEYEGLMASLSVSVGDASKAQEEFNKLVEFAEKTPFDLPGVIKANVMFRNAGIEAEKLIPTISMLGDVAQGSNDYFNRMALNLMQIKSVGHATAMDINQFGLMGVPMKQTLKELGVTGQASFEDVQKALERLTSQGGQFFGAMAANANTLSGMMSNLRDSMKGVSNTAGKQMLPVIKELNLAVKSMLDDVKNTSVFNDLMVKIKETTNYIKLNLDTIIATMINVGTIAVSVASAMALAWAVIHWPITLVILGITTIIKLLYDSASTANETSMEMTNSFNQVSESLSVMFGVMSGIGAIVGGVFDGVYNVLATVWNLILSISEHIMNIGNWFAHPIQSIKNLFLNLASDVLNILSSVLGIFSSKLSKSINEANEKLNNFRKEQTPDLFHYNKAELKDTKSVTDSINAGVKRGAELGSVIDKNLSFRPDNPWFRNADYMPDKYKNYMLNKMPEIPQLPVDDNGNLKVAVQNEIKIDNEYKRLLMEKAVEQYRIKYSQSTPQINFGNVTISNEVDADNFVTQIAYALEEASASAL